MKTRYIMLRSYIALAATFCVWGAVWYLASFIHNEQTAYLAHIQDVATQSDTTALGARLHVLAESNATRSQQLDAIVSPDAARIIDSIKSVGSLSGVPIKITSAVPDQLPKSQKDIHAIALVIEAVGSFESMMHVLALFEKIPLASMITLVDLSKNPQGTASSNARPSSSWHLSIKMQVLTTASVSS